MPWYTLEEAAGVKRMSQRNLYRLLQRNTLISKKENGVTHVWIDETEQGDARTGKGPLPIPEIPPAKLTDDVMTRVDAMMRSIAAQDHIASTEDRIDDETGLPAGTQRRYKAELRSLYGIPPRSDIFHLITHPQIKLALAHIIIRKSPITAGEMLSARGLSVVSPTSGQIFSIEEFIKALYSHRNHNAKSCHLALVDAARSRRLLDEKTCEPLGNDRVPSEASVRRFLRNLMKENKAMRRSRMSRSERIADRIYISRPDEEYRAGGKLEGDHTEDVTMVYRNDGKAAPLWTTMLVDVRTGMIKGYVHSYYPNSNTIALAYRNAVLGTQLEVATDDGYKPLGIVDAPDLIVYDNGKDYKSKFSGQVIGKVDFADEARRSVQLISQIHHTGKRNPQAKGHVEGTFHIIQETMLKYLPGYKGSNYSQKPDELGRQVRSGALLTEDQYKELFKQAVNALNNRPRKKLGDLSPLTFYLANQQFTRHVDERVLDFLMMKVEQRKISRGYVRIFNEEYFSIDLDEHNGRYCSLYYDPLEMGRMAVYIGGAFITFAVNKKLLGVTERDLLRLVKQRAQDNRDIAEEIRALRAGITSEEAKAILFNAELKNVVSVKAELLQKKSPTVVVMTGLEPEAKRLGERLMVQQQVEEAEERRDNLKKNPPKLINIGKLK